MNILGGRIGDFTAEARALHALLGLLSFGRRVESLSSIRRADNSREPETELAYVLLGIISATRTLRATLSTSPPAARPRGSLQAARTPSRFPLR